MHAVDLVPCGSCVVTKLVTKQLSSSVLVDAGAGLNHKLKGTLHLPFARYIGLPTGVPP